MVPFGLALAAILGQAAASSPDGIAALIERLGADGVEEREEAGAALKRVGAPALESVRKAQGHADPEVACRAREIYRAIWDRLSAEELNRVPDEEFDLADLDLQALSILVQRVTKKKILWTEDLGLRKRRARILSDVSLIRHPEILFLAYQSSLMVGECVLVPLPKEGKEFHKIRPSPGSRWGRGPAPVEEIAREYPLITRVFSLQHADPREVQAAFINTASYPGYLLADPRGFLLATDNDEHIRWFEKVVDAMDRPRR